MLRLAVLIAPALTSALPQAPADPENAPVTPNNVRHCSAAGH